MDLVAIIDFIESGAAPGSLGNADMNGDEEVSIMVLVWIIDHIVGN